MGIWWNKVQFIQCHHGSRQSLHYVDIDILHKNDVTGLGVALEKKRSKLIS